MMNTYQAISTGDAHAPAHDSERTALPERLLRALEAHAAAEAESMEAYERLADQSGDPLVALLMGLVLEDERRHHGLLERMAHNLDREAAASEPVPSDGARLGEAIGATRALIREEREGARYLRHLARQEPKLCDGTYALLLETMARDSEKHEHILRFILRRLEARG